MFSLFYVSIINHKGGTPCKHLPIPLYRKAIAQTQNYIFELEKKTVDKEYQNENSCKVVRPKGIILFGSQEPLEDGERQYLRILNSSYHNLKIITFQQLLEKAKNTLRIRSKASAFPSVSPRTLKL